MAKSWEEKYNDSRAPEVKVLHKDMIGMKAGQRMLLPTAKQVAAFIEKIPEGDTLDIKELRTALAAENSADVACPIVTSITLRTVAEYAHLQHLAGTPISETTPVWRVLNEKAKVTKKLSFDPAVILNEREREAANGST